MPLYEFQCKQCGDYFERMMRLADPHPTVCEKCGGTVEQLISTPSVQFKGTGFYHTDYRVGKPLSTPHNKGPERGPKTDSSAAPSEGSSTSEAKTESKPDPKPAAKAED